MKKNEYIDYMDIMGKQHRKATREEKIWNAITWISGIILGALIVAAALYAWFMPETKWN